MAAILRPHPDEHKSRYRPLDIDAKEIRVLIVQPGSGEDPVRCHFEYVSLAATERLHYKTISYVWGDPKDRGNVVLDGYDFNVPASSEKVLRRTRSATETMVLWIDAICINQQDQIERGHQVGMMGDVYSGCAENLIWLGESDETTAAAVEHMQEILQDLAKETRNFETLYEIVMPGNDADYTFSLEAPAVEVKQDILLRFLSSKWFTRLWVVQEAGLAPKSTCLKGEIEVPLRDVLRVVAWVAWKTSFLPEVCEAESMPYLIQFLRWVGPNQAFTVPEERSIATLFGTESLLGAMRSFRASDPRDHIFGLIGLHERYFGPVPEVMMPDYTASREILYTCVTRSLIMQSGYLNWPDELRHRGPSLDVNIASWTPRYDHAWDPSVDTSFLRYGHAARGTKARIQPDQDPTSMSLVVDGILFGGPVDHVTRGPTPHDPATTYLDLCRTVEAAAARSAREADYIDGIAGVTLQAGVGADLRRVANEEAGKAYRRYCEYIERRNCLPDYVVDSKSGDLTAEAAFSQGMTTACQHRNFFTTATGYIGLGPGIMKEGDMVAILYGCRYPVVLRAVQSPAGNWRFLGVAYVYGVMDGEMVNQHKSAGKVDDTIRLW